MNDERRPTWLELARLEQGSLTPESAARVRSLLEHHGPPDGGEVTPERAYAEQPAGLFLDQVRRRALAIGRRRLLALLAVGAVMPKKSECAAGAAEAVLPKSPNKSFEAAGAGAGGCASNKLGVAAGAGAGAGVGAGPSKISK